MKDEMIKSGDTERGAGSGRRWPRRGYGGKLCRRRAAAAKAAVTACARLDGNTKMPFLQL